MREVFWVAHRLVLGWLPIAAQLAEARPSHRRVRVPGQGMVALWFRNVKVQALVWSAELVT
jgi:hypothetical protein